jgi:integrase
MAKNNSKTPKSNKLPTGVRQLPDGRYRIRATVTTEGVTREAEETLAPGSSLGQAVDARTVLAARLRGEVETERVPPPFQTYADTWLTRRKAELAPSTVRRFVHELTTYALPKLGRLPLDQIDRRVLLHWRDSLCGLRQHRPGTVLDGAPLHTVTLQCAWSSTLQVLRDGWAEWDLRDPSARIPPPHGAITPPKGRAPSADEIHALLKRLEGRLAWLPTLLLAATGMRQGEVRSLLWSDVDLDAGVIRLRAEVTKSRTAREVPLPAPVVELLRERRMEMLRDQHPLLHRGLVFGREDGEQWSSSLLTATIKEASAQVGTPFTPHDLRRAFITRAVEAGINALTLRAVVGHSSEEMTRLYYRSEGEARRGVVERVWDSGLGLGPR